MRFELTIRGYRIPVFETGAFSHSATCPLQHNKLAGLEGGVNAAATRPRNGAQPAAFKAVTGSTRAADRAGNQEAPTATRRSTIAAPP